MSKDELSQILKDMYNNAKDGEKVAMIHLFGMKYGNEIKQAASFKEIAQLAGIQESYATEISKGSKIADVSKHYNHKKKNNQNTLKNNSITKNIVLYGAPGVGKTHNYQNLISMIENGNSQKEIFDMITSNEKVKLDSETFQTIKDAKRVEFVTFHQMFQIVFVNLLPVHLLLQQFLQVLKD